MTTAIIIMTIAMVGAMVGAMGWKKKSNEKALVEANTFMCYIDPTKKIYYAYVDEFDGIKEFDFDSYILYMNGKSEWKGSDSYDRVLVSNDIEELKETMCDVLQRHIDEPHYPQFIKIKLWNIPNVIVDVEGRRIHIDNITEIYHSPKYCNGYTYGIMDAEGRNLDTKFESPEDYAAKLEAERREVEEQRLNRIINNIQNICDGKIN